MISKYSYRQKTLDVNGKKVRGCLKNPDGFWCNVCPSSTRKYWEEELMDLPSPSKKG